MRSVRPEVLDPPGRRTVSADVYPERGEILLRDELWADGTLRGQRLRSFLEERVPRLADKTVLDLGCATGGITRVFGEVARLAIGADREWDNVSSAARRPSAGSRVWFVQSDALELPFAGRSFDVVLMSGLLEWLGFARPSEPPGRSQLAALCEVRRVLKDGGCVAVGIENRWFPKFLWRSPHQHLRFALLFPARLAWALPQRLYGTKVHERLYGPRGLTRLLRSAGFSTVEMYLPLFSYQFPREVVASRDGRGVVAALRRTAAPPRDELDVVANGGRWGRRWFNVIARLGVQRWLAPSLLAIGRKGP